MPTRVRPLLAALTLAALLPTPAPAGAANGVWTPTLPATGGFDNLSAFADGTAYATVGVVSNHMEGMVPSPATPPTNATSAGYFKTTDFGRTWTPMPPPSAPFSGTTNLYLRFATSRIGYATFASQMDDPAAQLNKNLCRMTSSTFRTTDGGAHWTALCEPGLPNGHRMWISTASPLAVGPDGNTVVLTGDGAGTFTDDDTDCVMSYGAVAFSANAGASWRVTRLPKYYTPGWSVRAFDNKTALVNTYRMRPNGDCSEEGSENAVFLTTDAGRTYRKVFECKAQPICTSVAFASRTHFILGHTDGSTTVSLDGGKTWRHGQRLADSANDAAVAASGKPDEANMFWVQAMSFVGQHGYASTRGGGTWRTDDGGVSWSQERSHECVYYPWGVGENATATADVAITGGPGTFSVRAAAPTPAGPCHPQSQVPDLATDLVAATAGPLAVHLDGTLVRRAG